MEKNDNKFESYRSIARLKFPSASFISKKELEEYIDKTKNREMYESILKNKKEFGEVFPNFSFAMSDPETSRTFAVALFGAIGDVVVLVEMEYQKRDIPTQILCDIYNYLTKTIFNEEEIPAESESTEAE